ncbi:MAG: hypothetical protein H6579_03350 [Chitinophagales bacterium]|nr:hypothetical protein [Chitinophagales bacterium]
MGNAIQFGIYKFCILFVLLAFSSMLRAQVENDSLTDRMKAYESIDFLKNGALIVRLRSNSKKIDAYRSSGNTALADKLEQQQHDRNLAMLQGFKENFDFCKLYFIWADDYKRILDGENSSFFLNEKMEVDSTIRLNQNYFLFCDFGPVYVQALENQYDPKNKVVSSTPAFQEALVIKDLSLTQLLDPFPFYVKVRFYEFGAAAEKLNSGLYKYLAKSWSKKK